MQGSWHAGWEKIAHPVYCYEHAAFTENRRNLAVCRSGEYEGLETKLKDTRWKPDFGPVDYNDVRHPQD